jgi:hypothetical protein
MNDITAAQRRAKGYWFVDGVAEMAGGVAILLCGGLLWAAVVTGIEWLGMAAIAVLIAGFPVSAWIVRTVKERITYPRTGYVGYPSPSRTRMFAAGAIGFVVAGLLVPIQVAARGGEVSVVVLATGAAIAASTALRAWRPGAPRFYVVAAALFVAAGILASNGTGVQEGIGLMLGFYGATLMASGTLTLMHYLRTNRLPETASR